MHCVYNHYVELIDADNARGESYNVTHLFRADADVMDTWFGRYLDRYEKREGEWRIAHRVCVHEGTTSGPLNPMPIASDRFRQGSFDRPSAGRLVGP